MDFGVTGQGGESIILSSIYKKYWEIGFKTRLYDWLSPEAYLESLQRVAGLLSLKEGEWVLDAGCGSGLLLPFLADQLKQGGRYLGMDILPGGLASLNPKANRLNTNGSVTGVLGDLSKDLPLNSQSVSCVVAHFSVYTLPDEKVRRRVYQDFWRVLKLGGLLITANPTHSYNAEEIIRSSLELLRSQAKPWAVKKYMVYPLTLHLGLKLIERQLHSGRWHGYQPEELRDEVARAGFVVEHSEAVYGGSGFLVVGRKP
jgi:ubiquinone/menaquinone biosynthesis C-methylase UbiE